MFCYHLKETGSEEMSQLTGFKLQPGSCVVFTEQIRVSCISLLLMVLFLSPRMAATQSNIQDDEAMHINKSDYPRFSDVRQSDYYMLEKNLLTNYKPHLRPVRSHHTITNISFDIQIIAIQEISEVSQVLRHTSWLNIRWKDEFLTWLPEHYNGIQSIELPEDKIWTPNLSFTNSASGQNFLKTPNSNYAIVYSSGLIFWGPIIRRETMCNLDVTFYPFDIQICSIVINVWSSKENEVNLTSVTASVDNVYFVENSEWQLTNVEVERKPSTYETQQYSKHSVLFHLKRRRLFHTLTLVVPNVLLALLVDLVFLLPGRCGEKLSFSMSLLLAFAVNLSVLVSRMPPCSLNISIFMIYLTALSIVTALSVITTVCLLRLYHSEEMVGTRTAVALRRVNRLLGLRLLGHGPAAVGRFSNILYSENSGSAILSCSQCQDNEASGNKLLSKRMLTVSMDRKANKTDDSDVCGNEERPVEQENVDLIWKDAAAVLDYLLFRTFAYVIFGMTSVLVLTFAWQ